MDLSNQIKFLIYKTEQEQINVSVVEIGRAHV